MVLFGALMVGFGLLCLLARPLSAMEQRETGFTQAPRSLVIAVGIIAIGLGFAILLLS